MSPKPEPTYVIVAQTLDQAAEVVNSHRAKAVDDLSLGRFVALITFPDGDVMTETKVNAEMREVVDESLDEGRTVVWLFHHDWCFGTDHATIDWALDRWRACMHHDPVNIKEHLKELSALEQEYLGLTDT